MRSEGELEVHSGRSQALMFAMERKVYHRIIDVLYKMWGKYS